MLREVYHDKFIILISFIKVLTSLQIVYRGTINFLIFTRLIRIISNIIQQLSIKFRWFGSSSFWSPIPAVVLVVPYALDLIMLGNTIVECALGLPDIVVSEINKDIAASSDRANGTRVAHIIGNEKLVSWNWGNGVAEDYCFIWNQHQVFLVVLSIYLVFTAVMNGQTGEANENGGVVGGGNAATGMNVGQTTTSGPLQPVQAPVPKGKKIWDSLDHDVIYDSFLEDTLQSDEDNSDGDEDVISRRSSRGGSSYQERSTGLRRFWRSKPVESDNTYDETFVDYDHPDLGDFEIDTTSDVSDSESDLKYEQEDDSDNDFALSSSSSSSSSHSGELQDLYEDLFSHHPDLPTTLFTNRTLTRSLHSIYQSHLSTLSFSPLPSECISSPSSLQKFLNSPTFTSTKLVTSRLLDKRKRQNEESNKESTECVICRTRKRDVIFDGCGHLVVCWECHGELRNPYCPVCRRPSVGWRRVYWA